MTSTVRFFSSARIVIAVRLGFLVIGAWTVLLSSAVASGQPETLPRSTSPAPAEMVQPLSPQAQAIQDKQNFHSQMLGVPLPSKGCFIAKYPKATWQEVPCGKRPTRPYPLARGVRPTFVGSGNDYFALTTSYIASATGSFDSVTGVTAIYGPIGGDLTKVFPDIYTLQMNTNQFPTPICGAAPGCTGWQQFIFSQTACEDNSPCIFMQYWLPGHPSPCPGGDWTYYKGSDTTEKGCYMSSVPTPVSPQTIANLGALRLTGTVIPGGTDQIRLLTASGDIPALGQDSTLQLGQGWSGVEFNLFGDCCGVESYFNEGSSVTIRVSTNNGTTACSSSFDGATAETSNLNLGTCASVGGTPAAIVFSESGGGPPPVPPSE